MNENGSDSLLFSLLRESVGGATWYWDVNASKFECEPELLTLFGLERDFNFSRTTFDLWQHHCKEPHRTLTAKCIEDCVRTAASLDQTIFLEVNHQFHAVRCLAAAICDENGKLKAFEGVCYEDKNIALEKKVIELEGVFSELPVRVFWKDTELNYLGCNKQYAAVLGLDEPNEIIGKSDYDFQRQIKYAHKYREDDQQVLDSGLPSGVLDQSFYHLDGSVGYIQTLKVPLKDCNDDIYAVLGVSVDISHRVQRENEYREQLATFRELINHVPVMIHSVDRKGRYALWNRYSEQRLGFTQKEIIGATDLIQEFFPDKKLRTQVKNDIKRGDGHFREYPVKIRDGTVRHQLWSSLATAKGNYIACGVDITDLKNAEQRLQTMEERYQKMLANMPIGYHLWEYNSAGELEFSAYNESANRLLSFDHNALVGKAMYDAFPSLKGTAIAQGCYDIAASGGTQTNEDIHYKDNKIDCVLSSIQFQAYPGAVVSMFWDVSEVRIKEFELKDAYDKLKLVTEVSKDGFWSWTESDANKLEWSDNFYRLLGLKPKEIEPSLTLFMQRLHPNDITGARTDLVNAIRSRQPFESQYRVKERKGRYVWCRARGTPYFNGSGQFIKMAGSLSNIDETKRLEQQLKASNDELAEFACVASHDLREPVLKLISSATLLVDDLDQYDNVRVKQHIQQIQSVGDQITWLFDDLMMFLKTDRHALDVSLNALIAIIVNAHKALETQINATKAVINVDVDTEQIHCDALLITEMFQHLIQNALKFQPAGHIPRIDISIRQDKFVANTFITVRDNGIGIAKEEQQSVFGVFKRLHTDTKFKGTGIGLAIVKKVVSLHDGSIEIVSELGKGCCFEIELPNKASGL